MKGPTHSPYPSTLDHLPAPVLLLTHKQRKQFLKKKVSFENLEAITHTLEKKKSIISSLEEKQTARRPFAFSIKVSNQIYIPFTTCEELPILLDKNEALHTHLPKLSALEWRNLANDAIRRCYRPEHHLEIWSQTLHPSSMRSEQSWNGTNFQSSSNVEWRHSRLSHVVRITL